MKILNKLAVFIATVAAIDKVKFKSFANRRPENDIYGSTLLKQNFFNPNFFQYIFNTLFNTTYSNTNFFLPQERDLCT